MQSNRSLDQGSELFYKRNRIQEHERYMNASAQGFSPRIFTRVGRGLGVDKRLAVNILLGRSLASNIANDLSLA